MESNISTKNSKKIDCNELYCEYKELREKRRLHGKIINYIALPISAVIIILGIIFHIISLIIIGSLLFIITLIYRNYRINHASKQLKARIISLVLNNTYKEASSNPFSGLDVSEVKKSTMIKQSASYKSTDLLTGVYKGMSFLITDLFLEEGHKYKDSYGKKRVMYEPFYKGTFIRIDLAETTGLVLKAYQKAEQDFFIPKDEELKIVETQSRAFNSKFKIVTNNEISCQRFFTKELIDTILKYDEDFKGKVSFGLVHDKLYVLVNHVNALNIRANKPFNEDQLREIIQLLSLPKNIINDFYISTGKYTK